MTITNTFLNELAKAVNAESYTTPSHIAVGTEEVTAIDTTDTSISGEVGDRINAIGSRTNNNIQFSGTRSGTNVLDTADGDNIGSSGLLTDSTGGNLLAGVVLSGITHTTSFDIEFIFDIDVERK